MSLTPANRFNNWDSVPFPECLDEARVSRLGKIFARNYQKAGKVPIVDQGQGLITGWTDNEDLAIRESLPVVVFGDHTRAFKFVNFPFAVGADGTHLLKPSQDFNVRFFYYACLHLPLPNRGYNRHFTVLKEQNVPKPPKLEQEKIAAVLWKVQKAVEVEEKLIATARELKHSTMRQLFTRGLRGEPPKECELGQIPQTWEVATLGDLFGIKHGFAFKGEFFALAGGHILLTPGHFFEEGGFRDQKDKTKYYTGKFPKEYLLNEGDLLVAMTEQKAGLLGSSLLVPQSDKYLHNQRLGLIVDLNARRLDKLFLFHMFNTPEIRARIAQTASGSKVKHTSPGKIRDLSVALPLIPEQKEIATILTTISNKISVHERKRSTLQELFRTLLRQLMTGQIRVHDLAIDLTEIQ